MPLLRLLGNVIKKKVSVPQFNQISADTEEANTIKDNLAQLPKASEYTRALNKENQSAVDAQINALIPGFSNISSKASQTIQDQLNGKIPQDVLEQIQRSTAARSVEGGFGGSEFGRNLTARDLGTTSLQLANVGLANAMNWLQNSKQNRAAPLMSPSAMFLSPEQRTQLDVGERDKKLQRDYLSSQLKAAQSWRTYMGQALGELDDIAVKAAMSYMGGMMGGGGGMGGMMGGGGGGGAAPGSSASIPYVAQSPWYPQNGSQNPRYE